tara:strand:+ start:454 stop:1383 length:930 start_codon:yes stop_codon:yes gene_type:complete
MDGFIFEIIMIIFITAILGHYFQSSNVIIDKSVETFTGFNNFDTKEHFSTIYDSFYSKVYNTLFPTDLKNEFEFYNIREYTVKKNPHFDKKDMKFLDLGCGTGKHLAIFDRENIQCVGIDKSTRMLEVARKTAPMVPLIKGDFSNKSVFKKREFTHIFSLFFTIYYSEYPEKIFKNVNYWLQPNGYFCVHLVDPERFDPVLESSSKLIPLFNPQKHSDKRMTQTKLKFNKFDYISDWKFEKDNVEFIENFVFKDHTQHRQNRHKMKMKPIKHYKKLAKKNGFKLIKIIDLLPANHDDNFLYIFQKKYGS